MHTIMINLYSIFINFLFQNFFGLRRILIIKENMGYFGIMNLVEFELNNCTILFRKISAHKKFREHFLQSDISLTCSNKSD